MGVGEGLALGDGEGLALGDGEGGMSMPQLFVSHEVKAATTWSSGDVAITTEAYEAQAGIASSPPQNALQSAGHVLEDEKAVVQASRFAMLAGALVYAVHAASGSAGQGRAGHL